MSWNSTEPFNDLPSFPSAEELETSRVLKQCIRSRTALAELNQSAEFLPNKEWLINIMPLLEARASSEIENIVTTSDALFRSAVMEKSPDPATKEALSYRQSLYAGYLSIQDSPRQMALRQNTRNYFQAENQVPNSEGRSRYRAKLPSCKLLSSASMTSLNSWASSVGIS